MYDPFFSFLFFFLLQFPYIFPLIRYCLSDRDLSTLSYLSGKTLRFDSKD